MKRQSRFPTLLRFVNGDDDFRLSLWQQGGANKQSFPFLAELRFNIDQTGLIPGKSTDVNVFRVFTHLQLPTSVGSTRYWEGFPLCGLALPVLKIMGFRGRILKWIKLLGWEISLWHAAGWRGLRDSVACYPQHYLP